MIFNFGHHGQARLFPDGIGASMLLNGDASYAPFVKALDIRTDHYAGIIVQRKGQTAKKKDDAEKPE
jgi:hypothetical protein